MMMFYLLVLMVQTIKNNAKLEELKANQVVTNTYTLKLPNKNLLKEAIARAGYNKLAVVAMIINN